MHKLKFISRMLDGVKKDISILILLSLSCKINLKNCLLNKHPILLFGFLEDRKNKLNSKKFFKEA